VGSGEGSQVGSTVGGGDGAGVGGMSVGCSVGTCCTQTCACKFCAHDDVSRVDTELFARCIEQEKSVKDVVMRRVESHVS